VHRFDLRFLFIVTSILLLAGPRLLAGEPISLSVDATGTQQKLLHIHEAIPVKPGPLTLYYPKWIPASMVRGRSRASAA